MKAEEARKMTDEALVRLTEALERGQSDALTQYLAAMSRFHQYSFGNIMLITAQRPDATLVAGFNAWKDMNRWVKKGEKGIVIIAPMILKKKETAPMLDGDNETVLRFKAVYVFDVSQTEGDALPEFERVGGNPGRYLDRLKTFIASRGIVLTNDGVPGSALGASSGGTIRIRPHLDSAQEFSVLAHELAHEMLHQGENKQPRSKKLVETEAEAVAFVITHAIGLDTGTAASDYIQLYKGDKNTLAESLERIQRTSNTILEAIAEEETEALAA